MSPQRFEPYAGDDLAARLQDRCGVDHDSGATCDRMTGHAGEHVEVSGIGLVLQVWGSEDYTGGIDDRTRDVIERLARIREALEGAIQDADWQIRCLRNECTDDEVLVELIDDAELPDDYMNVGLTDDEGDWPAEIEALRRRIAKRKERAA